MFTIAFIALFPILAPLFTVGFVGFLIDAGVLFVIGRIAYALIKRACK